jgi:hypothetical protein
LLCRDLAQHGLPLAIAGRNPQKGDALAGALGATTRYLDVADRTSWFDGVRNVGRVVMCIDQPGPDFVAFLCERGIDYIDVTASDAFFRQLESLRPTRSSVLLSVGLAPGLTNMLARHLATEFDSVARLDIGLLFGLGDRHGAAGLDWMAAQIFDPARRHDPLRQDFGPPWGRRMAHIVDFSDQHALMRSFPCMLATTRVAFDSRLATAALFQAARRFADNPLVRTLTRASFSALRFGSRAVNVTLDMHGLRNGSRTTRSARFLAEGESQTTARLASLMIRQFLTHSRPGLWHTHDLLDSTAFLTSLATERLGHLEAPADRPFLHEITPP